MAKKPEKRDPSSVPFHMMGDEMRRNRNIDDGKRLCNRCDGTGNELFSMFKQCSVCKGTGEQPDVVTVWKCPSCKLQYHTDDKQDHIERAHAGVTP